MQQDRKKKTVIPTVEHLHSFQCNDNVSDTLLEIQRFISMQFQRSDIIVGTQRKHWKLIKELLSKEKRTIVHIYPKG